MRLVALWHVDTDWNVTTGIRDTCIFDVSDGSQIVLVGLGDSELLKERASFLDRKLIDIGCVFLLENVEKFLYPWV